MLLWLVVLYVIPFSLLLFRAASREYLLCLLGKVDIDVHAALGFFQDCTDDLDAFNELAEFSTRLSIRDTSQVWLFCIAFDMFILRTTVCV